MKYAQKAADDLKSFIKRFQPLIDVAKVLEEVGSLDNAVEEVKKAKANADAVHADAIAKKEKAVLDLEKAQAQVDSSYKLAQDHEAKAQAKAQQILADAHAAAKGIEQVAFEKLQKSEAQKNVLVGESAVLSKEIEEKKLELAELVAKISDVKVKLANFLK